MPKSKTHLPPFAPHPTETPWWRPLLWLSSPAPHAHRPAQASRVPSADSLSPVGQGQSGSRGGGGGGGGGGAALHHSLHTSISGCSLKSLWQTAPQARHIAGESGGCGLGYPRGLVRPGLYITSLAGWMAGRAHFAFTFISKMDEMGGRVGFKGSVVCCVIGEMLSIFIVVLQSEYIFCDWIPFNPYSFHFKM